MYLFPCSLSCVLLLGLCGNKVISETDEIFKGIQVNGKIKHHVTNFIRFVKLTPLHSMATFLIAFM